MATEATIRKVMATLLIAYPTRHYSTEEIDVLSSVWIDVLSDVPDETLKATANEYLRSNYQFAPAPGQLRTRAIELTNGDNQTKATDAWFWIYESNFGREQIPDPLVVKVVGLIGGFDAIGNTESDKMCFVRERFLKLYAELAGREQARQFVPALHDGINATQKQIAYGGNGNGNGNGHN